MSRVDEVGVALSQLLLELLPRPDSIRNNVTLREQGLDSMTTTRLWLELESRFGVDIPLDWLAHHADPDRLARRIAESLGASATPQRVGRLRVHPDPDSRYDAFPLTPMQESYLTGGQTELTADAVGCRQYLEFEVRDLDVGRLHRGWQRLVDHHDALRAVVTTDGIQRVHRQAPSVTIPVHNLKGLGSNEVKARIDELRQRLAAERRRAGEWPLFTVEVSLLTPATALVHLSFDMLTMDGHGLALLLEQWHACYQRPEYLLPAVDFSLRDCVMALRAQSLTRAYRGDLEYWMDKLKDLPPGPPVTPAKPGPEGFRRATLEGTLPPDEWCAVREKAEDCTVTASALVLAAFAQSLSGCTQGLPFSLIVTTSMRPWLPPNAECLPGPFTSSAVVIVRDAQQPVEQGACQLQQQLWEALQHASVCGTTALRHLRTRHRSPVPPPVVFTSLLGAGPGGRQDAGFGRDVTFALCRTSEVSLEHQIWEHESELRYRWDVTPERFPAGVLETAFAAFENSLRTLCSRRGTLTRRPLNDLQQAYYVARMSNPRAAWNGCQIYETFHVGGLDLRRLERALLLMVRENEAVRTSLSADGLLEVRTTVPDRWSIPVIDLDGVEDPAASLATIRDEMAGHAFPPGAWPPFEVRVTRLGGSATVHCSFDLAVADARSIHELCREIFRLYDDPECPPRPATSPDEPPGNRGSPEEARDAPFWEAYWEGRLAQLPPGPELAYSASSRLESKRIRMQARLPGWSHLAMRASRHNLAPDMLLLAAFLDVLAGRLGGRSFTVPVVCFPMSREHQRPGELTVLSWMERATEGSLLDRAGIYQRLIDGDLAAGAVSGLGALRRRVMRERGASDFAFPVVYTSVVDLTASPLPSAVQQGDWLSCTSDVSLDCIGVREGDDLFFCWDAVAAHFPAAHLAEMFADYRVRLEALLRDDVDAGPEGESNAKAATRRQILYAWNHTLASFPTDRLMHQLFEDRARERPGAIALRGKGWTQTYAELNRESNRIASHLKARGMGPETVVGIAIRRGPSMVAACFGVLKAGGVYLPVDPSLPQERAMFLLSEARAATLLTTSGLLDWQLPQGTGVVCVDRDLNPAENHDGAALPNPEAICSPDNTAYIMFTSGSTGKPKGVAVAHRAVLNLLHWCNRTFHFGVDDLGLCVTALSFDLSVWDIFGLLGAGGALYLADEEERRDPQLLLEIMLREKISIWNSAPASLQQLTPFLAAVRCSPGTGALRLVFLSGDYTPLSVPADIRATFPRARIVNLGGATEATVWSNFFPVEKIDPHWRSIPYGKPIDNARYHVLDKQLEPCAVGVEGNLYIGGECLSQGYYRRPDLTAERFIPDPFAREPGQRLYCTGDRACYLPDGNLSFLGREDGQVKIRGFRVEPGEIEYRLRRHPGVEDAVVAVRSDPAGDRKLVAYVLAGRRPRPDEKDLRTFVAQALPDYMVPNFIAVVDTFPVTANGKLDRQALPWPFGEAVPASPAGSGATELQEEVAALFAKKLGLARFDVNQDMWSQGATSFTVVQVSNALQDRYGKRIPVSVVLADPTAGGIARWLMAEDGTAATRRAPLPGGDRAPRDEAGSSPVDFFSEQERRRFKEGQWGLRPLSPAEPVIALPSRPIASEYYRWRTSKRDLLPGPVPHASFCRLLGLLRQTSVDGRARRLYPSAGDTYAVQAYLHIREGGVEGIEPGIYYYRAAEHALQLVRARPDLDRQVHFYYNRPLFDSAAFELYLIGQTKGIEPVYRENAERYMAIEAGHMSQLLMTGQATCRLGLCPIGDLAHARIREQLGLDPGHRFLLSMLGGRAEYRNAVPDTGETPPFADRKAAGRAELAIIGMAGRYPGAENPEALWQQLASGRTAIGPLPADRRGSLEASSVPDGGFLERIDEFDSAFFNVSPAEAEVLDPQLRMLLETVWECLENAGHTAESLHQAAGRVGVIVGAMWQDYQQVGAEQFARRGEALVSGSGSEIAHRISRHFDFQGPSFAVDAACTSSVAAIHLAAESIRRGECGAVVLAAANLVAHPYHLGLLSGLGLTAQGKNSGAFDADRSGWMPGEGVAAVLLRPAADAFSNGDVVHGVIEATAMGHSGAGPDGLALSLERLLASHGISPHEISYVECAAAGSSMGDAAEIAALAKVFGGVDRRGAVTFGTLKPNIGHLEAAAGLSQLAKVLMQMRHGQIAPTRVAERRNPLVDWADLPLRPAESAQPWSAAGGAPLRALINALGANGAYAHLIVRSAPPREISRSHGGDRVVPISAATQQQVVKLAQRLREHLTVCEEAGAPMDLADVAFTLQTGRAHMAHRLAIVCADIPRLLARLDAFIQKQPPKAGDLAGAAAAWVAGQKVDWSQYWATPAKRVSLPTYPFARLRHWIRSGPAALPTKPQEVLLHPAPGLLENRDPKSSLPKIEDHLLRLYSEVSGIAREDLDTRVSLEHYGLSSLLVTRFNILLERDFGRVPRTFLYEHRTLAEIAERLSGPNPGGSSGIQQSDGIPPRRIAPPGADVAIIGLAGRYPLARNLKQFWANLISGRDCIAQMPAGRSQEWPGDPPWGGYLEDVDQFDSLLFNIVPRDADLMDPQERLFLEVVWEALDDAGYPRTRLRERYGSRVGVYVGSMYNEYPFFGVERSLRGEPVSSGAGLADIANRVSYFFDLRGPSMTVDTLCSSSLTCVHLAVESLRRGECDVAIAGGVNLSLHPNKFAEQARYQMASSTHRCRSFGAGGDGIVPGEGVGAAILKPLPAALADGDRILAVIKGTAVNHGGRTTGYMVPNPVAQAELIRRALDVVGVPAASISYLEAHGTGTHLGDPIEINGLERAFGGEKPALGYWPIGSVKSSIGHLEGAAGMASLTKVVLQLTHGQIAPSLHAGQLNPNVNWKQSAFQVQRQVAEWYAPRGDDGRPIPRRAGISSFGAGGANAHVIVEEHVAAEACSGEKNIASHPQLILLSAPDEERLQAVAAALLEFLCQQPVSLADVAYTLQMGREHLRERLAVIVSDLAGLRLKLEGSVHRDEGGIIRGRAATTAPFGSPLMVSPDADLAAIGTWWASGGQVDWSLLYPSRRPKLVSLPSYPFARRRHWVPWEPGRSEVPAAATLPAYEKTWKLAHDESCGPFPQGPVLLLFHSGSEAVATRLSGEIGSSRVIGLCEGPVRGDGVQAYSDEAGGVAAIESILSRYSSIAAWVDLCDLYRRDDEPGPWVARLRMLQRLLASRPREAMRLLHVTSGLQDLESAPPSLAGARIAGLIRMLRAEHRDVAATTMDIDAAADRTAEAALRIAAELGCNSLPEICYRQGKRYRPKLSAVTLPEKALRLNPEQVYVVTGGMRGLGSLAARRLVDRGARRLALMALHPLPPRKQWDDPGLTGRELEAIRTLRDLERGGAQVETYFGALTERARVDAFLARARGLGEIGGIIHCAGLLPDGRAPFCHRDPAGFKAVFEPKVEGLEVLADLCSRDRPSFFLLFSSIAAAVPALAAGAADYAAANAFMDWFAGYQTRKGRPWFGSVVWPAWRGAGMSSPEPPAYARLGLGALDVEQGLRYLEAALCRPAGGMMFPWPGCSGEKDLSGLLGFEEPPAPKVAMVHRSQAGEEPIPAWLVSLFAGTLGISEKQLDPEVSFGELGVESVLLAELLRKIEAQVGCPLEPAMLLDHATLAGLSAHLSAKVLTTPTPQASSPLPRHRQDKQPRSTPRESEQQIAIIGMACRFPGALDPAEFWANLRDGRCAIAEIPASRWDAHELYRPRFEVGGSISKWGGFIDGIEDFDASHFDMSEEEATCLDPAIRLMLENVEACLADAGYERRELWGKNAAIVVGARISDYGSRAGTRAGQAGFGSDQNFMAARVAHHLNVTGPAYVVDSACSSSLVSLQLAVRSLLAGESELALAGGVEVLLEERTYVDFSAVRALSPTGRCRAFDENADGFVPGEGCGVVLLKRLSQALRDGDRIHAVINSVAVNNDGRTVGLTTPNPTAQAAVIRSALEQSGLLPEHIAMVEAHGTGTILGDPIEMRALADAFGVLEGRTANCAVGSVKSNLGHLLSAAGMAGLLKAVLSVEHGEIPPTLFCDRPNPRFNFEGSPFYPNLTLRPWPADRSVRAAGISSFGLGGTNAHAIVTALDPSVRAGSPEVRKPLAPPVFRRRRLWLDCGPATGEAAATVVRGRELVASILNLEFVGNGRESERR
jgi:amino acid adenylation domain-containing protein